MKIIFSRSQLPVFNIAAEEYFFARTTDTVLLLYVNAPSVIIGSNQAVLNEVDLDFCRAQHIQIIRRMSGGGAVYHDEGNLNYCFIGNVTPGRLPVNADFLIPIMDVLRTLQLTVTVGARKDLWLPGHYKVSGTASHISRNRTMYHGTLLYDTDLGNLYKALSPRNMRHNQRATPSVRSAVKNMHTYLSEKGIAPLSAETFFQEFTKKIIDYFDVPRLTELTDEDVTQINTLVEEKYTQKSWNFRI